MSDIEKLLTALGVKDGSVSEALERIALLQETASEQEDCKRLLHECGASQWAGRPLIDMLRDVLYG